MVEQLGDSGTLQDGRHPHPEGPPAVSGLACESGLEGCLYISRSPWTLTTSST